MDISSRAFHIDIDELREDHSGVDHSAGTQAGQRFKAGDRISFGIMLGLKFHGEIGDQAIGADPYS